MTKEEKRRLLCGCQSCYYCCFRCVFFSCGPKLRLHRYHARQVRGADHGIPGGCILRRSQLLGGTSTTTTACEDMLIAGTRIWPSPADVEAISLYRP